jgi:hypothetical protein
MPYAVVPVFTNVQQFYVRALGLVDTDITRFVILNSMPPPVVVPTALEQQIANTANVASDGATAVQLVPLGVNGTLQHLEIFVACGGAVAQFHRTLFLKDGSVAPVTVAQSQVDVAKDATMDVLAISYQNVNIPFTNGLHFTQGGDAGAEGYISLNALYRTP